MVIHNRLIISRPWPGGGAKDRRPPPLYTYDIMLCSPFLTAFISIVLSMNEDDSLKTLLTRALK